MSIQSAYKTLSYIAKSRPFALEKPKVLQFPVIDICNSKCQMCRIWENKQSDDITPDALRKGLHNPLYSEVTGVGLNGGEPTLRKDLGELAAVLFDELPKLQNISLITNAYKFKDVIARIGDVGEVVKQNGGNLDVMVSLDGYGAVHDRVRGKPGNFRRAQYVIDFIQQSPLVKSVRIGCTIIRENVYGLHDLLEYCKVKGLYIKYRLGVPHQRLYTENLLEPYALTFEEKYHVVEFLEGLITHYEPNAQQNFFYRSLVGQMIRDAPRTAGCDWQHRGATITSKGELLYCAVQSKRLGMIQTDDSEAAYFGAEDHLREIIATKCDSCHHDYVGILPREQQLKRIAFKIVEKTHTGVLVDQLRGDSVIGRMRGRQRFDARIAALKARADTAYVPEPQRGRNKTEVDPNARRVMVCGWYGTETLGDKAILGGVVHALQAALGRINLTLVALHPYITHMTRRQMPELKGACIVNPDEAAQLVKETDLLVFGGGPLMGLSVLADMEALFAIARGRGVPTLVAGCGVGPLGDVWQNESLKRILDMASLRIYRDDKAPKLALELGVNGAAQDTVAEDPAFTWLAQERGRLQVERDPAHQVLLLGLRDFPHKQYARDMKDTDSESACKAYEAEVIRALHTLVQRHPGLIIRPLPMCTNHFGDDDRWFYRRLFRGHAELAQRLDLSLLGREMSPVFYAAEFRKADVALAMRFHALVFALGLEVPTVAIDYTLGKGKVRALAERFGVPFQSLLELKADFIVAQVETLLVQPVAQAAGFEPAFTKVVVEKLPALMSAAAPLAQAA
jgi:polysaccharide pyruvyl transferase WcaK-like protein/sulfatase maturation enzyme AslB (radical SAM superfamily)